MQLELDFASSTAWDYSNQAIGACDAARLRDEIVALSPSHSAEISILPSKNFENVREIVSKFPALERRVCALREAELRCLKVASKANEDEVLTNAAILYIHIQNDEILSFSKP